MGKPNTKPKKIIAQFDDFTHYGEIKSEDGIKRYYYKYKSTDKTILAVLISKKDSESEKLKKVLKCYKKTQTSFSSFTLMYKGIQADLPCMDKLNRAKQTFITFETFDYDLELELKLRVLKKRRYEESELWGICFCAALFLNDLYLAKIVHGNLSLKTIFSKQNRIKFCLPYLLSMQNTQFRACKGQKKCYYSAEIRDLIKHQKLTELTKGGFDYDQIGHKMQKSDVYSLGLIVLELATLNVQGAWFDHQKGSMMLDVISARLSEVKLRYSKEFYSVLREMLLNKENLRPSGKELCVLIWSQMRGKKTSRVDMKTVSIPDYLA